MKFLIVLSAVVLSCLAQRSPYAGRNPVGYPIIEQTTSTSGVLADRFGESDGTTTTMRIPLEARGDIELVKRLLQLPVDRQPFWLVNWQALEEQRKNPQTFTQRGNEFVGGVSPVQL